MKDRIRITLEYGRFENLSLREGDDGARGNWFVKSDDVPGLFLWGPDLKTLADDIPVVVNKLRELNKITDIPEIV